MRLGIIRAAILCGAALLNACVSEPSVRFDRAQSQVAAIGLLPPYVPNAASVPAEHGGVGEALLMGLGGAIGGLIAGSIEAQQQIDRTRKLQAVLDTAKFSAADIFVPALMSAVQVGYATSQVPAQRSRNDYVVLNPIVPAGVDALLDVVVLGYGYKHAGNHWSPFVVVKSRLSKPLSHKVIMEATLWEMQGDRPPGAQAVPVNSAYEFRSLDEIAADPGKATAGLKDALTTAATAIAARLQ